MVRGTRQQKAIEAIQRDSTIRCTRVVGVRVVVVWGKCVSRPQRTYLVHEYTRGVLPEQQRRVEPVQLWVWREAAEAAVGEAAAAAGKGPAASGRQQRCLSIQVIRKGQAQRRA